MLDPNCPRTSVRNASGRDEAPTAGFDVRVVGQEFPEPHALLAGHQPSVDQVRDRPARGPEGTFRDCEEGGELFEARCTDDQAAQGRTFGTDRRKLGADLRELRAHLVVDVHASLSESDASSCSYSSESCSSASWMPRRKISTSRSIP